MPKKVRLPIVLLLAFALAIGLAGAPGVAKVAYEPWGPHVDEVIMPIIKEAEARRIAFERGESVVWGGLTRPEDIDRAKIPSNSHCLSTLYVKAYGIDRFNMAPEGPVVHFQVSHFKQGHSYALSLYRGL
jgi:ABC-type transport system substrate-binding protein